MTISLIQNEYKNFTKHTTPLSSEKKQRLQGNFEFGISRVMKAMEPQERRLGTDTWYYAKRCLLATIGYLLSEKNR